MGPSISQYQTHKIICRAQSYGLMTAISLLPTDKHLRCRGRRKNVETLRSLQPLRRFHTKVCTKEKDYFPLKCSLILSSFVILLSPVFSLGSWGESRGLNSVRISIDYVHCTRAPSGHYHQVPGQQKPSGQFQDCGERQ